MRECGMILGDCLIEAAQRDKHDAQVGSRRDHFWIKPNDFLVLADGQFRVAELLGLVCLLKQLMRIRRLRCSGASECEDEQNRSKSKSIERTSSCRRNGSYTYEGRRIERRRFELSWRSRHGAG